MDFDKIVNDDGFYLYKDNNFNTIDIQMLFLREKGNIEDAIFGLLCKYLLIANKNYKTEFELNQKKSELYSIDYSFNLTDIGSKSIFALNIDLISPSVVKDDYSKEAFEFIRQVLYEPDFTREDILANAKRVYLSSMLSNLNNHNIVSKNLYEQTVFNDPRNEFKYSTSEYIIRSFINSVTLENLEKTYNETIKQDNFLRTLVFGNITDEEFKDFRSKFNYKDNKKEIDYRKKKEFTSENVDISSETASESIIYITYSLNDIDEGSRKVLYDIFNGSGDLCTEILREKYGLVYTSNVQISYNEKSLIVRAKIDKNNKEKFIEAVDEMIDIVKDKNKMKELLEKAKKSIKYFYYLISEENYTMLSYVDDYIGHTYGDFNDIEFVKNIDSYKVEDVIKYTKTLKRKNIFMYRGDRHE